MHRALDKKEYLVIIQDNFYLFCLKTYVVTPHLKHLDGTIQMRGHMRNKKHYNEIELCM